MKKILLFSPDLFGIEGLLAAIQSLFTTSREDIVHITDETSFQTKLNDSWHLIIINFQTVNFWHMTRIELDAYLDNMKRCQMGSLALIGITNHTYQKIMLERRGIRVMYMHTGSSDTELKTAPASTGKVISIDPIRAAVCERYDIAYDDVLKETRKREIVKVRQLSMHFAKVFTPHSLKVIGEYFGGKDHTTVMHSCQTVKDLMSTDPEFKEEVEQLFLRLCRPNIAC